MSKSVARVEAALAAAGVETEVLRMPASTHTAEAAAEACGCGPAQIVKSLVFEGAETGELRLLLVSGANRVDPEGAAEALLQADAKEVRRRTGFAIGGVAPVGHLAPIAAWLDETLTAYPLVWAAAGAPDAVFAIAPDALARIAGARIARIGTPISP